MSCVDFHTLASGAAGELSAEASRQVDVHVEGCVRCASARRELRALARRLGPDDEEFADPSFASEVRARAETMASGPGAPRPGRLKFAAPALVALAAATVGVVLLRPSPESWESFQARGSTTAGADRWVSLNVFRATAAGYAPVTDAVRADDALAFSYTNDPAQGFRHLMVLAVDGRGRVFWYYPAHLDERQSPPSVSIAVTSRPVVLGEQVRHALEPGPLRVFALFTVEPLDVRGLEAVVARDLAAAGALNRLDRLRLPGVGQHSRLLEVVAGEQPAARVP